METTPETSPALPPTERLTPVETRVLGSLMEKERLTPDNYPLSLHALVAACNQTTNRDPVLTLGEREINESLDSLRQKKLATVVFAAGARVQKYRHNLFDHYNLDDRETALLCTLLLRGPQTTGELRARTERMAAFAGLPEVESSLDNLAKGEEPLVRLLPARPGQKERRYVQLLSGEPVIDESNEAAAPRTRAMATAEPAAASRLTALENEVRDLRSQLEALHAEFERFKGQFD